jgi:hypothetical protein
MNIQQHEQDYQTNAWVGYTLAELGQWVHLLAMRAGHRSDVDKRNKDLYDAQNYLDMMQSKLNELKQG